MAVVVPWMSIAVGLADGETLTGGPCGALPEIVSRDDDRTRLVGDAAWMRRLQLLSCTSRANPREICLTLAGVLSYTALRKERGEASGAGEVPAGGRG